MQLKVCLGSTQHKISWSDTFLSFNVLYDAITRKLSIDEDMLIYYLDDASVKHRIDDDRAVGRFLTVPAPANVRCVFVDLPKSPVITDRSFVSFEGFDGSTSDSFIKNGESCKSQKFGDVRAREQLPQTPSGEANIRDFGSNKNMELLLHRIIYKIDGFRAEVEQRIDNIDKAQARLMEEVAQIRSEGRAVDAKVTDLAANTSASINALKSNIDANHASLSGLINNLAEGRAKNSATPMLESKVLSKQPADGQSSTLNTDELFMNDGDNDPLFDDDGCDFVACSKCNSCPIEGDRYKCTVCDDFMLCKQCHDKNTHKHPLDLLKCESDMSMFKSQVELSISSLLRNQDENRSYRLSQTLSTEAVDNINLSEAKQSDSLRRVATDGGYPTFEKKYSVNGSATDNDQIYKDFSRFNSDKPHIM